MYAIQKRVYTRIRTGECVNVTGIECKEVLLLTQLVYIIKLNGWRQFGRKHGGG